jgi:hypothetical protein
VKIVIQPAHRVLDGSVQIPERVRLGHLDATPNERVRSPARRSSDQPKLEKMAPSGH